ncbi:hypothetical protein Mapa_012298 [Marchantia paleacea]|nr:hypothetical protein Mapa_012298 [Marchantia paleacea]
MNFESQTTQVWPLPVTTNPDHTAVEEKLSKVRRRRRICFWCLGITVVVLVVLLVIFLSVLLTVLQPKIPRLQVEAVNLTGFSVDFSTDALFRAEVFLDTKASLANPNYSSFKYRNSTAYLYYYGALAGETAVPAGEIKSRCTAYMTNSLHIFLSGNVLYGNLSRDVARKMLPFTTALRVEGTVSLLNILKRKNSVSTSACDLDVSLGNATWPWPFVSSFQCRSKMEL